MKVCKHYNPMQRATRLAQHAHAVAGFDGAGEDTRERVKAGAVRFGDELGDVRHQRPARIARRHVLRQLAVLRARERALHLRATLT